MSRRRRQKRKRIIQENKSNIKNKEKVVIYSLYDEKEGRRRITVLNQYICLECNKVNLVDEILENQTELFNCKDIKCRICDKVTTQICVKDKTLAKFKLEVSKPKTEKEKLAHQAIFVKKREINRGNE